MGVRGLELLSACGLHSPNMICLRPVTGASSKLAAAMHAAAPKTPRLANQGLRDLLAELVLALVPPVELVAVRPVPLLSATCAAAVNLAADSPRARLCSKLVTRVTRLCRTVSEMGFSASGCKFALQLTELCVLTMLPTDTSRQNSLIAVVRRPTLCSSG